VEPVRGRNGEEGGEEGGGSRGGGSGAEKYEEKREKDGAKEGRFSTVPVKRARDQKLLPQLKLGDQVVRKKMLEAKSPSSEKNTGPCGPRKRGGTKEIITLA